MNDYLPGMKTASPDETRRRKAGNCGTGSQLPGIFISI